MDSKIMPTAIVTLGYPLALFGSHIPSFCLPLACLVCDKPFTRGPFSPAPPPASSGPQKTDMSAAGSSCPGLATSSLTPFPPAPANPWLFPRDTNQVPSGG